MHTAVISPTAWSHLWWQSRQRITFYLWPLWYNRALFCCFCSSSRRSPTSPNYSFLQLGCWGARAARICRVGGGRFLFPQAKLFYYCVELYQYTQMSTVEANSKRKCSFFISKSKEVVKLIIRLIICKVMITTPRSHCLILHRSCKISNWIMFIVDRRFMSHSLHFLIFNRNTWKCCCSEVSPT